MTFILFQEYVANLLKTAFPHLTDNQVKITVQGLFNLNQDIPAFKDHLRDFLVQIRVNILIYELCTLFLFNKMDSDFLFSKNIAIIHYQ